MTNDTGDDWEVYSLQWIHDARERVMCEAQINKKDLADRLRTRKRVDARELCKKLGLRQISIVSADAKRIKTEG